MLHSLSSIQLSRHAVELEKRSIHLSLEEGNQILCRIRHYLKSYDYSLSILLLVFQLLSCHSAFLLFSYLFRLFILFSLFIHFIPPPCFHLYFMLTTLMFQLLTDSTLFGLLIVAFFPPVWMIHCGNHMFFYCRHPWSVSYIHKNSYSNWLCFRFTKQHIFWDNRKLIIFFSQWQLKNYNELLL